MDQPARRIARELLAWYRQLGVDEAIEADAIDWLARGEQPPGGIFKLDAKVAATDGRPATGPAPVAAASARQAPSPISRPNADAGVAPNADAARPMRQFPTARPEAALTAAQAAARQAMDLAALSAAIDGFEGCALKATAKNTCVYRGADHARLMLIGEAPGRDEDLAGQPFVGPAGRLLDKMLAAIGLGEDDVHITNAVYWRPPGNRTPSPQETQICRPFLERQVELVEPMIIVPLGGAAAKLVLGAEEGIMRLRGKWRDTDFAGRTRRVLPTLHPAYLLRTPAQKRLAWRDLLAIEAALEQL